MTSSLNPAEKEKFRSDALSTRVALGLVLLASGWLNVVNNDFPLGYHYDEPKKVNFIQHNRQDFLHPILMLQLARVSVALCGSPPSDQTVAQIGRTNSALAGVICIYLLFGLSRRVVGSKWAVAIAAMGATCPALVVHAHYLKEDMVFLAALLAALLALEKLREEPSVLTAVVFGVCAGLAFSSHYKSILLVPIAVAFLVMEWRFGAPQFLHPRLAPTAHFLHPRLAPTAHFLHPRLAPTADFSARQDHSAGMSCAFDRGLLLGLAGLVAAQVFGVVNYPMLDQWSEFSRGVKFEFRHAIEGHRGIRLYPWNEFFTYHWRNNVTSGMTTAMAVLGLAGMVMEGVRYKGTAPATRLMMLLIVVYYAAAEMSPSKPYPDDMRYVLPCIIGWIFFAGLAMRQILAIRHRITGRLLFAVFAVAGPLVASVDALMIVGHLDHDNRRHVEESLLAEGIDPSKIYFSVFASATPTDPSLTIDPGRVLASGAEHWVLSSFTYRPLLFASQFPNQLPEVYREADALRQVLQLPSREFQPRYRSIGFSDPTLRVFNVDALRGELPIIAER